MRSIQSMMPNHSARPPRSPSDSRAYFTTPMLGDRMMAVPMNTKIVGTSFSGGGVSGIHHGGMPPGDLLSAAKSNCDGDGRGRRRARGAV